MLELDAAGNKGVARDLLQVGNAALQRLTTLSQEPPPPEWKITDYETDIRRTRKIGMGGTSDVYEGTCNGRVVAIKELVALPVNSGGHKEGCQRARTLFDNEVCV